MVEIKEETFEVDGRKYYYYPLNKILDGKRLEKLPRSLRILLESMVRNLDGRSITQDDIDAIVNWNPSNVPDKEIRFKVSRVVMQDFTGVPAVVDLASMRDTVKKLGKDPELINPQVRVDLVIDHSVQVDYYGESFAIEKNEELEFNRNLERYKFLKWAQKSFKNFRVIPPGTGIIHQVNLEYLAEVIFDYEEKGKRYAYFDTLVGTDSHTTMINGIGVLGWGVGGIEAEAALLGQPITISLPEVIGVRLHGELNPGVTATDLVLTITELLRKVNVVDKFVEFFGPSVKYLSVPERATVSNMCPEYGATLALFPIDDQTLDYLRTTGRSDHKIKLIKKYLELQGMFGESEGVEYTKVIDLDLSTVKPSVAGPKLPQQRLDLDQVPSSFLSSVESNSDSHLVSLRKVPLKLKGQDVELSDGDIVIAAITSCTNTSNPYVMLAAGLVAKKAVELGLKVNPKVKTSLAPGSRVVTDYLTESGLIDYLDKLGFYLVGYGCTTCIGNSGPLDKDVDEAIIKNNLNVVSVLSGNRNFEARIHKDVKANYLMSPPLVVAYAIAGNITINLDKDPLGEVNGKKIYLKDIWPSNNEIKDAVNKYVKKEMYEKRYGNITNKRWESIDVPESPVYNWDESSTYIRNPPFFENFKLNELISTFSVKGAYPLLILGDSVTTDHISPAGSIPKDSPAGKYLIEHGVKPEDFNSYGSRRGNHEVMMRGTFANVRIRNLMVNKEGGYTIFIPDNKEMSVYDAAMKYRSMGIPLVVVAGREYGTGSSRDWAAKGTYLLGVRAVLAKSYERIHRSNLVGMGVIPIEYESLNPQDIDFTKKIDIDIDGIDPGSKARMTYTDKNGESHTVPVTLRVDTPAEADYIRNGGILQYSLRKILSSN
ncbi:aconitate hydratase [Thermoplasma volcanium GSS1]|uniref:aconitate hydratase n=1 Tax=Thermoplasma volcanium (strain ATCC 51530 / DSM 4299 / JCM 9571 / NBRC 15438 / GSS1) TaxID=273116 RepID=Q97CB3_THEVO|nr:aconitate hydratase AcnA [Thermoplasma volcanium]BAB59331.1 aconitate hydratase [Thermoplasma volcanium GSS1]